MTNKFIFILFSLFFTFKGFSSVCYFTPPDNWKCSDPKKLSKHVYIGFVGKGKHSFNPSINFASEKTDASLEEYISAIKNSHKNERNTEIRVIGKIQTEIDGSSKLIEISKKNSYGDIRILQLVTKKDDQVYILTGAVLKSEFTKFKNDFFTSFKSLKLTDDLLTEPTNIAENIPNLENVFSDLKNRNISMKEFEKHIEKNYNNLGLYWKILVLKQAHETISKK